MKIGIPRSFYFYLEPKWLLFFKYLKIDLIISDITNKDILNKGNNITNDEACLSLKVFMGHVDNLIGKCDYIFIPIISNYGKYNQGCANYLSLYELVKNKFDVKILDCLIEGKNEYKSFLEIGKKLNFKNKTIKKAYKYACILNNKSVKKSHQINCNKLKSSKPKILVVGHAYNVEDTIIGKPIINFFNKMDCEVIKSYEFDFNVTKKFDLCEDLYFKYSRENTSAIGYSIDKIDGIVFITSFPCGLDSLVNELVIRKINKPFLNLIIDDISSNTGLETRLESFMDIIKGVKYV